MVDTTEGRILTPYGVFRNVFFMGFMESAVPMHVQRGNCLHIKSALHSVWAARQSSWCVRLCRSGHFNRSCISSNCNLILHRKILPWSQTLAKRANHGRPSNDTFLVSQST